MYPKYVKSIENKYIMGITNRPSKEKEVFELYK